MATDTGYTGGPSPALTVQLYIAASMVHYSWSQGEG